MTSPEITMKHPAFVAADRLAPVPDKAGTVEDWARHYAALALAAYTAFETALRQPGPELGYLTTIGNAATAAACALTIDRPSVAHELWSLTPEAGALNGEWEGWLTDTLDDLGINPADIDPRYTAADFGSPSVPAEAVAAMSSTTQPGGEGGNVTAAHEAVTAR